MKIAILASSLPPYIRGGGEISTQILAESLSQSGENVHLLCCGEKPEHYEKNGVSITKILSPNMYWNFAPQHSAFKKILWHIGDNFNPWARQAVSAFLKQSRADILVTSTIENFGAEAWNAPSEMDVKTIHILRSYYPMCRRGTAFKNAANCLGSCVDCKFASFGRRNASQKLAGVIGISRAILNRHIEEGLFCNASRAVIPDQVSAANDRTSFKKRNIPPVFGYLGFLTPNKGIEIIADALRYTPALANISLLIAGTSEKLYEKSLLQKFSGLNAVFQGWVESRAFLSTVDFLIVPSLWNEPFGRIVIEAFTAGVPVIGSRIGGIAELITTQKNGFLFEPGDARSLSNTLMPLLNMGDEAYRELSSNAIISASYYSSKELTQRFRHYFEDVLSAKVHSGEEWVDRR